MIITREYIIDSLAEIGFDDYDEIIIPPIDEVKLATLPRNWRDVLIAKNSIDDFLEQNWMVGMAILPRTISLLKTKVKQIALIEQARGAVSSLLYLFTQNGSLRIRVGYQPISVLPEVFNMISVDMLPVYQIHNGFIDLISCDAGFLPTDKCEVFLDGESGNTGSFLKVFGVGPNSLGFDLDSRERDAFIIWGSDEEIEPVDDFWAELDQWIAAGLDGFDDNT